MFQRRPKIRRRHCGNIGQHGVEFVQRQAVEVGVVDTTGAGDAFCGSLAARLSQGDDLDAAVRWAAAAGALATTTAGAVRAQPYRTAIESLLGH